MIPITYYGPKLRRRRPAASSTWMATCRHLLPKPLVFDLDDDARPFIKPRTVHFHSTHSSSLSPPPKVARRQTIRPEMARMASPLPTDPSLETVAPHAAVTRERRLNPDLQEQLPKPYLARALAAVDPSHPQGTNGRYHHHRGLSVLQQHAAFFDRNGDGIIYPWETFQGMRAIGTGYLVSFISAFILNLTFSYPTQPGWLPSPLLSVYVKNIHKGKHGSDSEAYDTEGRFDPSKFDAIFSKYGLTHPNALTLEEMLSMLKGNRNLNDFIGWVTAAGEWLLLYSVAKDKDGLLQRETVRGAFDGSLFERLQEKKKFS